MRSSPGPHRFGPRRSVIKPLIIANVVVFALTGFGSNQGRLTEVLLLHSSLIKQFQLWRLVTYMFLHGSFFHIFFNMWGLYLFGAPVEQRLGSGNFLRLYLLSGAVGGGLWLLANWGGMAVLIGASGGVFGVMLSCAMAFPNMRITLLFPPIPMRVRTFVFVYAFIEVMSAMKVARGQSSGIAHLAHLGGLLGAFFYMKHLGFQSPYSFIRNWLRKRVSSWRRRRMHVVPPQDSPRPGVDLPSDWEAQTDRILDKIGEQGIQSLTPEERQLLEMARARFRHRSGR